MACQRAAMSASASSQLTRVESPFALAPGALQRVQDAVRVIDTLQVVVDLGAQRAARERMRRIAGQRVAVPSWTSTIQAQVSGQSCPQAPRMGAWSLAAVGISPSGGTTILPPALEVHAVAGLGGHL